MKLMHSIRNYIQIYKIMWFKDITSLYLVTKDVILSANDKTQQLSVVGYEFWIYMFFFSYFVFVFHFASFFQTVD